MSMEIPLSTAAAVSEAAKLAATVDSVAASLRNTVSQSNATAESLRKMAQQKEQVDQLSRSLANAGNSTRKLNADVLGHVQAMESLSKSTNKAMVENAKFANQVINQGSRVNSIIEKQITDSNRLAEARVKSDKRVLDSSKQTTSHLVASMKQQNEQAAQSARAWRHAHKEQIASIKELRSSLDSINKRLKENSAAVKLDAQETDRLSAAERKRAAELKRLKSEQRALTDEVNKSKKALSELRAESRNTTTATSAAAAAAERTANSSRGLAAAAGAATVAGVAQNRQNRLSAQSTETLGTRVRGLSNSLQEMAGSKRVANQATASLRAGMIASGTSFGIFTSETIVAAVAIYGVVSALKEVIQVGSEFEDAMVRAFAIMDITGQFDETQRLTEYVREIGRSTKFTSTEAAEGLVLLGMAGLDSTEAIQALGPALDIASIGMTDMAFSADLVTNVMNEFGMEASDIRHIADVLAVAVTGANVSIEQLGLSLSYVGPIANATQNSLEDTVAMIQVMGDNAIKASRAGTSLRRAMANLLDPNEQAISTMVRLGVSARDLEGNVIPLIDFMKQMAQAGAEVDDVFSLFGVRAGPAMQALLQDLKKGFDENGNAIAGVVADVEKYSVKAQDAADASKNLREAIEDTLAADARKFISALTDVGLSAFEELQANLRELVQGATEFLRNLDPDAIKQFTRAVVSLGQSVAFAAEWGIKAYLAYKAFKGVSTILKSAAAASEAMAFASGSMVGPISQSATKLQSSAMAMNAYTPAALRGAGATRVLSAAVLTLQAQLLPLLIFSGIAYAIYEFSTASSEGAVNSAKLRAEMALERREAEQLAGATEELTEQKKNLADAQDRNRIRANEEQIGNYRSDLEDLESQILRIQQAEKTINQMSATGVADSVAEENADRIGQLRDSITELQALIAELEADSERVRTGIVERTDEFTRSRESGIAVSSRKAEILRDIFGQGQEILSGVSLQASSVLHDLEAARKAGASVDLGSIVEEEKRKGDVRFSEFQADLDRRQAMREVYLDREVAMEQTSAREAAEKRSEYLSQNYSQTLSFIDNEISHLRDSATGLEQEIVRMVSSDMGGAGLENAKSAYTDTLEAIRELTQLRSETTAQFNVESANLQNTRDGARQEEENAIKSLIAQYDPLMGALFSRIEQEQQLQTLLDAKLISETAAAEAMRQIAFEYENARTPVNQHIFNLETEIALLKAQEDATESGNFAKLVRLQLTQQGVTATEEEIQKIAELMATLDELQNQNKTIQNQADPFQKAWEEAIRRVDEGFEDMWIGAFDSFTDFRDNLVDAFKQLMATLAHETISKPILINMGLLPAGSVAAGGSSSPVSSAAGSGTGISAFGSLLGGGLTQSMAKTSAMSAGMLQNLGLDSLATSAVKQANVSAAGGTGALTNIGLSIGAGFAGQFAGNKLGEAIFGKKAESSIATGVLGAFGTVVGGPLGAFIGSTVGAALDTAFGGDGKVRLSAGMAVGPGAYDGKYSYGTDTFDSGLQISKVARRVDQEAADAVISQYKTLDSLFTSVTRGAGIDFDLTNTSLPGFSADAGNSAAGSFFGLKGYNGLGDTEEQLKQGSAAFVRALIDQVSGSLSSDVVGAIEQATGTAEDILNHYGAVLALDDIFQSGSKLFTNINNFSDTMTALSEQFQLEGESLGETVTRIKTANDSLAKLGIGDGSTSDTVRALSIADAAGGIENLTAMVDSFADTVTGRARELENVTQRLSEAVSVQFSEIGLSVDDFDVESFRDHFDDVKDSVDAIDLVKLVQAGNSLGLLTELEAELAEVRKESLAEFTEYVDESLSLIASIRDSRRSITDMLDEIAGTVTAPSAIGGTIEEQIQQIQDMADYYVDTYNLEMDLREEAHKEAVKNYEEQLKLSEEIGDYLHDLSLGDLSTLSSQDRRDIAYERFVTLADAADAGDLDAASKLTKAAEDFLKIERERETTSAAYVSSYDEVVGRLSGLKGVLDLATDPGEFSPQAFSGEVVSQLQGLQAKLDELYQSIAGDAVDGLLDLGDRIADLPAQIRNELRSLFTQDLTGLLDFGALLGVIKGPIVDALEILPDETLLNNMGIAEQIDLITSLSQFPSILSDSFRQTMMDHLDGMAPGMADALQYAVDLDALKDPIVQALGLLPDKAELNSLNIAEHINRITRLSEHPYLLSTSLSSVMGSMIQTLLANGNSPSSVADAIYPDQTARDAANDYLNQSGTGGDILWYTSNGQSSVNEHLNAVVNQGGDRDEMIRRIFNDARDNNVSSDQLAYIWNKNNPNETYSPQQLREMANQLGVPQFAEGAFVNKPTFGMFGEAGDEVVSPVKDYATFERKNLISDIIGATRNSQDRSNREVVSAIRENTMAVRENENKAGSVVHIKVVTEDGKTIVNKTVNTIKERSRNGEVVIHAKGIGK